MNEKAIEKIKTLLVKHKETHIRWKEWVMANPKHEEECEECGVGGIKHQEECIRDYDEALQALAELAKQPEAGEFTKEARKYFEDYRNDIQSRARNTALEACVRLDQQAERIKKMYAGDLSPESRLAGYSVVVKAQKKRIKQLKADKGRLEEER